MKIFLIRHGQSEGNVNPEIYSILKDHNVPLTDLGREQSLNAGKKLKNKLKKQTKTAVFISPYLRTRQTWSEIKRSLKGYKITEEETPLLREQEYKIFANQQEAEETHGEKQLFGPFWYRYKNAESIADVYQRVQIFLNTLHLRKISKTLPSQIVIVAHEITIKNILMILKKLKIEESDISVSNGEIIEIDDNKIKVFE